MQTARFRPLAVAGAALALMLSTTSFATAQSGSTFLLQLGEHSSQDSARSQWDNLQFRYPDQLSSLTLRVSPVRISGNKEAFRTQAAGLTSYAQAQSICTELSGAGVSCSVVETSMYQPEENVAPVVASSRPASPRFFEPKATETAATQSTNLQPVEEIAAAPQEAAAPVEIATANPSPKDNRSFGQKYLPWLGFGSGDEADETAAETAAVAPVTDEPAAESSETVTLSSADAAPATRVESRAAAQDLPVAAPSNTVRTSRTPVQQFGSRPTPEELAARAPRNLAAPKSEPKAEPVMPQTTAVAAAPAAEEYVDVPNTPQNEPEVVNVSAEAEVAEAVQVPVSTFDTPAPVVRTNRPVGQGGFPSQPAVTKAGESWVQLGYFASKEAAFAFSRDISRQHPDLLQFVRIRIVNPYEGGRPASARSGEHTSMRLGPFKEQATVNRVCAIAKESKLSCSRVNEVGTSASRASAAAGRSRYNPAETQSRREAVNRGYSRTAGAQPAGAYWVQLGAFDTTAAAQQRWVTLQNSNKDKLGRLAPQVSYPALSSSAAPVYHLRTGPFINKVGALDLCDSLRTRAVNCVVVQAR